MTNYYFFVFRGKSYQDNTVRRDFETQIVVGGAKMPIPVPNIINIILQFPKPDIRKVEMGFVFPKLILECPRLFVTIEEAYSGFPVRQLLNPYLMLFYFHVTTTLYAQLVLI